MNHAMKSKSSGQLSKFGSCNLTWKSNPTEDPDLDVVEYLSARAKKWSIQASREETSRIIRSHEKDADKLECIKTIFDDSSQASEATNATKYKILQDSNRQQITFMKTLELPLTEVPETLTTRCSSSTRRKLWPPNPYFGLYCLSQGSLLSRNNASLRY